MPPALTRLAAWLGRGDLGLLLQPVVTATSQAIGPYTIPAVAAGALLAVGAGAAQFLLNRRAKVGGPFGGGD